MFGDMWYDLYEGKEGIDGGRKRSIPGEAEEGEVIAQLIIDAHERVAAITIADEKPREDDGFWPTMQDRRIARMATMG